MSCSKCPVPDSDDDTKSSEQLVATYDELPSNPVEAMSVSQRTNCSSHRVDAVLKSSDVRQCSTASNRRRGRHRRSAKTGPIKANSYHSLCVVANRYTRRPSSTDEDISDVITDRNPPVAGSDHFGGEQFSKQSAYSESSNSSELPSPGKPVVRRMIPGDSSSSPRKGCSGETGADALVCMICNKRCARSSALTRHIRTHSSQTYSCNACQLTFVSPVTYKRHARSVHSARRVFKCSFSGCSFGSDRLSSVERHAVIHSAVRVYSCNRCGKTFAQENGLSSHLRSCLETRSYLCDLCGTSFNHLQSMQSHRRIHTGEKPFECDVCRSHFADYRNLKRHRRIHDNAFPYVCVLCSKKFRHSNSLKSHVISCHQIVDEQSVDK